MGNPVTKQELFDLENQVDQIIELSTQLNPSDPHDSELLSNYDFQLSTILNRLEDSYKKTRILELGLRIIDSQT